jgi:hypothetical protein
MPRPIAAPRVDACGKVADDERRARASMEVPERRV